MFCHTAKLLLTLAILLAWPASFTASVVVIPGAHGSGKPYVTGLFDGARTRLMLDTGSAITVLAHEGAFASYRSLGSFAFKSAAGVAEETETILIRQALLDGQSFTNVKVGRLSAHAGVENMLGIDLIGRQPFSMTFRQSPALRLQAKPPLALNSNLFVSPHGLLAIPIAIGGAPVRALWDTGASLTAVDQKFIADRPGEFKKLNQFMRGIDGGGNELIVPVYRARSIAVAGKTYRSLHVVAIDLTQLRESLSPEIQVVAGFNLIRKGDWYFDSKKALWSFQ